MTAVSMYRRQVERLANEIAGFQQRIAGEKRRAQEYRERAVRAAERMQRASSMSTASSLAREVERHEKSAVGHERRAADLQRQAGNRQTQLSRAQDQLDRALQSQRRQEDRDIARRRREDLAHIKQMERRHREIQVWPDVAARPTAMPEPGFPEPFDVCLTFAGEQRAYVGLVAELLKEAGLRVFYDQDEDIRVQMWGRDLPEMLDWVYRVGSRFCVMFISKEYAAKEWTTWERKSALDRALRASGEYILPARFDDTELPGLRPGIAYLDLREVAPTTLADFIIKKARPEMAD